MRLLKAFALITLAFIAAAPAQESRGPGQAQAQAQQSEWQSVITRQIEAFRAEDGAGALSCAGESFRKAFQNPRDFYDFIANSDYKPIVSSRSHSFGEFQLADEATVLQIVTLTGADQQVYKAMYEMHREADGWRVQGVSKLIADSIVT